MKPLSSAMKKNPLTWIALGGGSGLLPWIPGTWGTLAAVPIYVCFSQVSWPLYAAILVITFFSGVFICDKISHDLECHDDGRIVWDEMVGYWLTMFLMPVSLGWMLLGFLLFRLFDIWKPGYIRDIDSRVPGGMGIMLDDVLAAIAARVVLQGLIFFSV